MICQGDLPSKYNSIGSIFCLQLLETSLYDVLHVNCPLEAGFKKLKN